MANSDPSEWRLIDTDLVTVLGGLPASESHLYLVLNEPGSGELKIPLGSELAGSVGSGMFAQATYRGAVRGGFFVENISKGQADAAEGGGQWVSISGRGALSLLEDAIVWDDGTSASTRDFAGMTKAAILITLIDEAQARGALLNLSYDFTAVLDSDGVAWTDSETYKLNVGCSLLDITRQFARTGIDFDILPGTGDFVLSAYKLGKGSDKSETVYLRTGVNCEEVTSDEHGDKIKNAQLIAYKGGYISVSDAVSIAARRRREKLLDLKMAQTASSATTIGAAEVELRKDPQKSISVKIYDGAGPRGFVDYELGDYIMLDVQGTETRYRIYGVQPDWKGDQFSTVIVELNSILYENDIQLAQDVAWLLDQWSTANDAELIEVSYWAAIGDANIDYSSVMMVIVGDGLYLMNGNMSGGRLMRYNISAGTWEVVAIATPNTNCLQVVGTDIYLGGTYGVYKFDTTTDTLSTIALIAYAANPAGVGVYTMAVDGTTLYIAGAFDTIDSVAANGIIKRNTVANTWSTLADEASFVFPTVASTSSMVFANGNLYANGQMWNGTVFSNTGKPGTISFVYKMIAYGSDILIGTEDGLYIYDGVSWEVFGGTISGQVRDIAIYLTDIYIVGTFTDIGNRIARYSGGAWWELGTGLNNTVAQIELVDDDVYVLGSFTEAGEKDANNIAAYFNNFEALADYLENAGSSFNMGAAIHAATASAISDSDEVPFWEDVANALRKITWANIKATIKTYLLGGTSTTHVLFNDAGSIGGEDDFNYDKTTNHLTIGKSAPVSAGSNIFELVGDGTEPGRFRVYGYSDSLSGTIPGFTIISGGGTRAAPTRTPSGKIVGRFSFGGYDNAATPNPLSQAFIHAVATADWTTTSRPMKLQLWITKPGETTYTLAAEFLDDGSVSFPAGNVNIASGKTYNINGTPLAAANVGAVPDDGSETILAPASDGTGLFTLDGSGGNTISIANNATATPVGSAGMSGQVFCVDTTVDGTMGGFIVGGSFSNMFAGNTTIWSATKDTASKINVYQDAANGYALTVQNKTGVDRVLRFMTFRIRSSN